MHPFIRNTLAVMLGLFLGNIVNGGLIAISESIIPLPEGVDNTTMEGLIAGMHLFQPKHFIMPFLAHALGTLAGATIAALIAANNKLIFALVVSAFFLFGGIIMVIMLPSPIWFTVLDLGVAYIPMGLLAVKIANKMASKPN